MSEEVFSGQAAAGDEAPSPFAAFLRPTPPREVTRAFYLWVTNLVVAYGVGFVVGFLSGFLAARDRAVSSGGSGSVNGAALTAVVVGGLIGIGVVVGLHMFFLVKMRRGRNWARIVLTVLAVLNAVSLVRGFLSGAGLAVAVGLVSVLLLAAATSLMYRPAANAYFRAPNYS